MKGIALARNPKITQGIRKPIATEPFAHLIIIFIDRVYTRILQTAREISTETRRRRPPPSQENPAQLCAGLTAFSVSAAVADSAIGQHQRQ